MAAIAAAAHYSKYHLHRLFSQTVGLTIHAYQQRRRLTEAAKLLVFSRQSLLDIALMAGYESQQAFTTAFAAMYKLTPYQYRKKEEFYPLQCRFQFEGSYDLLASQEERCWQVAFATEADMPAWMDLVRLVIDGFPHLDETQYVLTLRQRIAAKQALILKDGATAVGVLLFSPLQGSIDFLGVHPLYRQKGIPEALLAPVMNELVRKKELSITTFRAGDKADTGHRQQIIQLGFAEAELLMEFGYPTQRFVLVKEDPHA